LRLHAAPSVSIPWARRSNLTCVTGSPF
jgi:hypothetical protein